MATARTPTQGPANKETQQWTIRDKKDASNPGRLTAATSSKHKQYSITNMVPTAHPGEITPTDLTHLGVIVVDPGRSFLGVSDADPRSTGDNCGGKLSPRHPHQVTSQPPTQPTMRAPTIAAQPWCQKHKTHTAQRMTHTTAGCRKKAHLENPEPLSPQVHHGSTEEVLRTVKVLLDDVLRASVG